jgi:DNA-binding transcriptional LysR family regulator
MFKFHLEILKLSSKESMHDLDLKTLRLMVAVFDHGSIKAAAAQEHIEPSAISKRISQLESVLGQKVLLRGRRGVELTAAGRTLIEHARTLLLTMNRIDNELAAYKAGVKGQVRLAASSSAIAESLLDDLTQFMRAPAHAHIKVNLEERLSSEIVAMVRGGQVPLGVLWGNFDLAGLQFKKYRHDQLVLAVHPDHPLGRKKSLMFEDTLDFEHVGLPPATAVHIMLQKTAAKVDKSVNYRVIVSNFDSAFRVVGANLGVSVVPNEVAAIHAKAGEVKIVKLNNEWAARQFVVCFRSDEDLTAAASHLLDFLESKASKL